MPRSSVRTSIAWSRAVGSHLQPSDWNGRGGTTGLKENHYKLRMVRMSARWVSVPLFYSVQGSSPSPNTCRDALMSKGSAWRGLF